LKVAEVGAEGKRLDEGLPQEDGRDRYSGEDQQDGAKSSVVDRPEARR
jgi:hypothetical protein